VKELLSSVQEAVQEAGQELAAEQVVGELVVEEGVLVQEWELEQVEVQVLELVVEPVLVQVEVEEREVVGPYCLESGLPLRLWFRSSKGERYNDTDTRLLSQF